MSQDNNGESGETEIASRTLQIQSKRFYLDVKQNRRGRFLKVAEVGASGQKSRILMGMSSTPEFKEKLEDFAKCYKQLEAGSGDQSGPRFKSETMSRENRRYFLDLKENQRGKFLRIAQQMSPSGMRSQIALPAEGIEELKDKLGELINECGTDDMAEGVEQLPESKSLRVDNKMFYFDVGANRRGTFLRISEVRPNLRTAVTVPDKSWAAIRDILDAYIQQSGADADAATADQKQQQKEE